MKEKEVEHIKSHLRFKTFYLDKFIALYPYVVIIGMIILIIYAMMYDITLTHILMFFAFCLMMYFGLIQLKMDNRFIVIHTSHVNVNENTIKDIVVKIGWKIQKQKYKYIIAYTPMNIIDFGSTITIIHDGNKLLINSKTIGGTIFYTDRNNKNIKKFRTALFQNMEQML